MRKQCKRKPPKSINPVLRAVCADKWQRGAVTAQIQAIAGGDPDKIAHHAGRVIYVILGASLLDGLDQDLPDMRIIKGAAGALYDLAGADGVRDDLRVAVISGLNACGRMCELLSGKSMVDAACDLEISLKIGHLSWSHFRALGVFE